MHFSELFIYGIQITVTVVGYAHTMGIIMSQLAVSGRHRISMNVLCVCPGEHMQRLSEWCIRMASILDVLRASVCACLNICIMRCIPIFGDTHTHSHIRTTECTFRKLTQKTIDKTSMTRQLLQISIIHLYIVYICAQCLPYTGARFSRPKQEMGRATSHAQMLVGPGGIA